jgi:hypothetical protein
MKKKIKQIMLIIVILIIIAITTAIIISYNSSFITCENCDTFDFMEDNVNNSITITGFSTKLRYDDLCFVSNLSNNKYYVQNNMSIGLNQINRKTGQLKLLDTITGFETGIKYTIIYEPPNEILNYVIFTK